jgi:hypothetical protein
MIDKNSSRRAFLSATVASFAWLIVGDRASAAPANLAGTPCKAKGRERTVDGVTFVCRNAKGKLVWRRKPGNAQEKITTVRALESADLELGKTKVVFFNPHTFELGKHIKQRSKLTISQSHPFPLVKTLNFDFNAEHIGLSIATVPQFNGVQRV